MDAALLFLDRCVADVMTHSKDYYLPGNYEAIKYMEGFQGSAGNNALLGYGTAHYTFRDDFGKLFSFDIPRTA